MTVGAIEAEQLLLSTLMISNAAVYETEGTVDRGDFHSKPHQTIYDTIMAVAAGGALPEPSALAQHLGDQLDNVGGLPELVRISGLAPASGNAAHYAHLVAGHATLRAIRRVGENIQRLGDSDPSSVDEMVDNAGRLVDGLASRASRAEVEFIPDTVTGYRATMDSPLAVVPTGFAALDDLIGGFTKGDLNLVGALSGHGKTSFLVASTIASCKAGRPVVYQALEMSKTEMIDRIIAVLAQLDLDRVFRRQLTKSERAGRDTALDVIETWPLVIDDDPTPTLPGMKAKARAVRREYGDVGMWVMDYLQKWRPDLGPSWSRQDQVSNASNALKNFAKVENLTVVGSAQLNQQADHRADKRPIPSDLRESMTPYHDSSVAIYVYREGALPDAVCEDPNASELIVRKQRNGATGSVAVDWVPRHATFVGRGSRRRTDDLAPAEWLERATVRSVPTAGDDGAPDYSNSEQNF